MLKISKRILENNTVTTCFEDGGYLILNMHNNQLHNLVEKNILMGKNPDSVSLEIQNSIINHLKKIKNWKLN